MRAHLLAAVKAGAPRPDALNQPPFPVDHARYFAWLSDLPCPVQWTDLEAWQRVTGRRLAWWEIDFLMTLDRVRRQ